MIKYVKEHAEREREILDACYFRINLNWISLDLMVDTAESQKENTDQTLLKAHKSVKQLL